ncbi:MAG TPA: hypothetical protein VK129_03625 [Terriglobales bacterium]|nr:hypothetical protein [Terriglobales bacterium]
MRAEESYSVQGQFGVQFVAQDLNADFNGEAHAVRPHPGCDFPRRRPYIPQKVALCSEIKDLRTALRKMAQPREVDLFSLFHYNRLISIWSSDGQHAPPDARLFLAINHDTGWRTMRCLRSHA